MWAMGSFSAKPKANSSYVLKSRSYYMHVRDGQQIRDDCH